MVHSNVLTLVNDATMGKALSNHASLTPVHVAARDALSPKSANEIGTLIAKKYPKQSKSFYDVFKYMIDTKVTDSEMSNVMLVSEKTLRDGLIDFRREHGTAIALAKAVLGFGIPHLTANETVPVIPTHAQLASDTEIAVFIVRYCADVTDRNGRTQPNQLMHEVKIKRGGRYKPLYAFANPYLEPLLRAQPEDHYLIGKYLTERGLSSKSEKSVAALREYLDHTKNNPVLNNGWL